MNENNEKKRYSFMHLARAVYPDGKPYIDFSLIAALRDPKPLAYVDGSNRPYLQCTMCIHNKGEIIGKIASEFYNAGKAPEACQNFAPTEFQGGIIYANATFWGKAAERMQKILDKRGADDALPVVVCCGALSITLNDQYVNVNLGIQDFTLMPSNTPKQTSTASAPKQQPAAPTGAWGATQPQQPAPTAPAQAPAPTAPAPVPAAPASGGEGFMDLSGVDDEDLPF